MDSSVPTAAGVLLFVGLVVLGLVVLIGVVALVRARANAADHPRDTPSYTQATVRMEHLTDEGLRAELLGLLQRGNKIAAIKRLREHSGLGLREAKDAVDALEHNIGAPLPGPAPAVHVPAGDTAPDADPEVLRLLRSGNKIAAIKRVRELTGWGLKEAKDYVDRL